MAIVSGHAPLAGVNIGPPGGKERMLRFAARRPRLAKCAFDVVRARLYRRPHRVLRRLTSSWSERDQQFIMSSDLLRNMLLEEVREAVRCGTQGVIKEIELLTKCWGFRLCEIPNMPVSIWHGACDPLTPPAMGHYFQRQIQSSEFFLHLDNGHVTTLKCNATEILSRLV